MEHKKLLNLWHKSWPIWLSVFIFLVPSNLFTYQRGDFSYVNGILSDYRLLKLYASDLAWMGLITTWFSAISYKRGGWKQTWLSFKNFLGKHSSLSLVVIGLATLLVGYSWQETSWPGLWQATKLIQVAITAWCFKTWWQSFPNYRSHTSQIITWATILALCFQFVVATWQVTTQNTLGGYMLLGEPDLNAYWGIAHTTWNGTLVRLGYGTTAHPNILAGWASLSWLLIAQLNYQKKGFKQAVSILFSLILTVIIIGETISFSGMMVLLIGILAVYLVHTSKARVAFFTKKVPFLASSYLIAWWLTWMVASSLLLSLVPPQLQTATPSLNRRAYLMETAIQTVAAAPWLGVGLNAFTTNLPDEVFSGEVASFYQPVHHLGWLWLAETGLVGIALLGGMYWLTIASSDQKHNLTGVGMVLLVAAAPAASWDHYLLTQQTGLLLLGIMLGTSRWASQDHTVS